ncbi:hypothetical protein RvY_03890 [Ramazzottius varieornatus]|uniref:GST C-terminal domain-containing protein n=1 Tax=Ramazzottius varieornatus TaxID=947166 RepID=A0A1D1UT42_RAMVA|nr:hypothetical protein RvY_03890 [Ramazzottius varieornatus]
MSKENLAAAPVTPVEPEKVILHQFPRMQAAPSLSPFALKLETYLRLAKISYQNDFSKPQSPGKGKCPWITFNNQNVADSSMCIEFLKTATGVDLIAGMDGPERAICRAFQKMVEEELSWVLALWRWVYDKDETTLKQVTSGKVKGFVTSKLLSNKIKNYTNGQGIGRHTQAEVMKIGEDDIRAVGDFLGSKKFFMGDLSSEIDCTMFGLFAQLVYASQTCPLASFVREQYPNIVEYCDRIKAEVWPDWEEICQAVKTEKEKKKESVKHTPSVNSSTTTEGAPIMNGNGNYAAQNGHEENNGGVTLNGIVPIDTDHVVTERTMTVKEQPTAFTDGDVVVVKEVHKTMIVQETPVEDLPKENGHHHMTNGDHRLADSGTDHEHVHRNGGFTVPAV